MKRLTTDKSDRNFATMLNFVFRKDGWAHIRHDGENADVPLTEWARKQCLSHSCDEFPAETSAEIDQEICDCMMDYPGCPVALAYCFASQAVHMRDRLKMYEDIIFAEDGTELISLEQLRTMVAPPPNPSLTLEELREMNGPIWCRIDDCSWIPDGGFWCLCSKGVLLTPSGTRYNCEDLDMNLWRLYRRKPERGNMNCEFCQWYDDEAATCGNPDSPAYETTVDKDAACAGWEAWPF